MVNSAEILNGILSKNATQRKRAASLLATNVKNQKSQEQETYWHELQSRLTADELKLYNGLYEFLLVYIGKKWADDVPDNMRSMIEGAKWVFLDFDFPENMGNVLPTFESIWFENDFGAMVDFIRTNPVVLAIKKHTTGLDEQTRLLCYTPIFPKNN